MEATASGSGEQITRDEYRDLQRRYLGLEWPDPSLDRLSPEVVSERMGVPIPELLTDLAQLRAQKQTFIASDQFRQERLYQHGMKGWKGIAWGVGMVLFCYAIFAVLIESRRWLMPGGVPRYNATLPPGVDQPVEEGKEVEKRPRMR